MASQGKTAVVVVTAEFESLAGTMAANVGWPGMRVLVLPYPLESKPEAEVREIARQYWPELLAQMGAKG